MTYCDGTTDDFKKPPHDFVTGENCNIQPEAFGISRKDGKYVVQNEEVFRKFFTGGVKGEKVDFSANSKAVRMDYKGKGLTIYRVAREDNKD